eukprot:265086-Chlamydomonas_euryale.AAC.2
MSRAPPLPPPLPQPPPSPLPPRRRSTTFLSLPTTASPCSALPIATWSPSGANDSANAGGDPAGRVAGRGCLDTDCGGRAVAHRRSRQAGAGVLEPKLKNWGTLNLQTTSDSTHTEAVKAGGASFPPRQRMSRESVRRVEAVREGEESACHQDSKSRCSLEWRQAAVGSAAAGLG